MSSPLLVSDWNTAPILLSGFCSAPQVPFVPRAVVRRPRGWHGQPGVALASANRRFRGSACPSLAAVTVISTAACSLDDKGASHPQSHTVASRSMGMAMATRPSGPEGVEWAGWECKFSGVDGKRVAVPEDYVPESLREWDVEVWGFEALTSEQLRRQEPDEIGLLYRKRARVFPEVGCALDNLSLEVNVQTLSLDEEGIFFGVFPGRSYVVGKKPASSQCLRMEAGLVVSGRDFGDALPPQETDEGGAEEQSRMRVEYQVETKGNEGQGELAGCLGATVTVTRERRYRAAFDDGLLYKAGGTHSSRGLPSGGGLDAQKLRDLLCSDCFSEKEDAPVAAALAGEWRCDPGMWSDLRNPLDKGAPEQDPPDDAPPRLMLLERSETFWESKSNAAGGGIECLLMRGGLTLRSGPWRGESDSDRQSWGGAAAADSRVRPSGLGGSSDVGKAMWAVEVGWMTGGGAGSRREVSTTVFDMATMEAVGAWRGREERL